VLLDQGLASVCGVSTKTLNQAVKRKAERFPDDFAFRLTADELAALRSQIVTSNVGADWVSYDGNVRKAPGRCGTLRPRDCFLGCFSMASSQ
jgi:hypothetical protein